MFVLQATTMSQRRRLLQETQISAGMPASLSEQLLITSSKIQMHVGGLCGYMKQDWKPLIYASIASCNFQVLFAEVDDMLQL